MNEAASRLVGTAVAAGRIALTKHEAKSLLTAYGMPVPGGGLALSEAAAVAIARGLNGAVAMKAVGARIQHKTEGGLVVLGIDGAEATAETYRLLQTRGGDVLEGVLVEKMVSGNRELLVGLRRDPVFGPVVSFGLGGVMT
jgi:acyl-CoA synthetase (NDP forming)